MSRRRLLVRAGLALALALAVAAALAARRLRGDADSSLHVPLVVERVLPIVRDEGVSAEVERTAAVGLPRHREVPLRLVVEKSRRVLGVERAADGARLKTYRCALGGRPEGAKEREGDERTPEGRYALIPHHESPSFGPCFFVCYPNADDAARGSDAGTITARQAAAVRDAIAAGRRPPQDTRLGGLILVHGTRDRTRNGLTLTDWTLGCVALENRDVDELLAAFDPSDRPEIEIRP